MDGLARSSWPGMRQSRGIELVLIYLSSLKLPYEALLLVYVDEIFYVRQAGFSLEPVYASWDIQAEDNPSHIENYCLDHNESLSGQRYKIWWNSMGISYLCFPESLGGEMVDTRDLDLFFEIIICKTRELILTLQYGKGEVYS